jgi:hypothetical protein
MSPAQLIRSLFASLLVGVLAGCDKPPGVAPNADAQGLKLQAEMEKASMDFSRVTVVRLQYQGRRLEVASVTPTVVAEARLGEQVAKTIFRIDDQRAVLVLFSRDLLQSKSIRTEMPMAQLGEKRQFSFPVVQSDGKLKEEGFSVERIVLPPTL